MRYVVLPARSPLNNVTDVIVGKKNKALISEIKSRHGDDIKLYSLKDNLICPKWASDILDKFGDSHCLDKETTFYYLLYWAELNRRWHCVYLDVKLNELGNDLKKTNSSLTLEEYMKFNGYKICFPPRDKLNIIAISKFKYYVQKTLATYCTRYYFAVAEKTYIQGLDKLLYELHEGMSGIYDKVTRANLQRQNIYDVKKIKFVNSGSGSIFYNAKYNGNKIFIKAYARNHTIYNEKKCHERLTSLGMENDFMCSINILENINVICYPWCETKSLQDVLNDRKLDYKEYNLFIEFSKRVLDGLELASIVHGDIRPSNIFVTTDESGKINQYKLGDFGLSTVDGKFYGFGCKKIIDYNFLSVGNEYRCAIDCIDDCASFVRILEVAYNGKLGVFRNELTDLMEKRWRTF